MYNAAANPDNAGLGNGVSSGAGAGHGLAQAMRRLTSDPHLRLAMGRAARKRSFKLSSPDAVLPILQSTYLRLAGGRETHPAKTHVTAVHPWEVASEFEGL